VADVINATATSSLPVSDAEASSMENEGYESLQYRDNERQRELTTASPDYEMFGRPTK